MEVDTWATHCFGNIKRNVPEFIVFQTVVSKQKDEDALVYIDLILPDDLLEKILGFLPVADIIRAGSVCKRWNEIVKSRSFLMNLSNGPFQEPWYFMFTNSNNPEGYAYDPAFQKWYGFDLPCIEASSWFISSSRGLVCFMDNDDSRHLFVCNPVTNNFKKLTEPPSLESSDYCTLALSADRKSQRYTITIARSKQVPHEFLHWDLSIDVYDSKTNLWIDSYSEVATGWRVGYESVICDGILYCLIYSTGIVGNLNNRHALIMYDLSNRSSCISITQTSIPVPCFLTCGRLMNIREMLVMVGGIGKQGRPDVIRGIGIWMLQNREWSEISRMPHKFFQGFGEFDDVFLSSGMDDLIYIQCYGAPALLVFDMNVKQWKWSQKCPVTKKFPLQLFTGFSFEPRLDVSP